MDATPPPALSSPLEATRPTARLPPIHAHDLTVVRDPLIVTGCAALVLALGAATRRRPA
ncbi:hypothetical protein [Streptomyces halobius]|uniref:MYXO-CTERM domain-containing protein n=1 Tax=Streptomyces halobius TaxID=2879846 RepID=A0ABY4M7Y5_9ACTN|nr:hypothetical protein [Streptomyces halobius]UQA93894.1 hypothetical protein K9S39_20255 [Streptomyces halobius]